MEASFGRAALLGVIGGLLHRHQDVLEVRPILREDSHEIEAMRITTIHGVYLVKVSEP